MNMRRWMQHSIPFAAVALVAAAPLARAQQQGLQLFEWNGAVDREIQIVMRGNDIRTERVGSTEPGRAKTKTFNSVPHQDGVVTLQVFDGRGRVNVVQQPSAQNGFTTIVRIEDPNGGAAPYRIVGYWQRNSNNDGYDRGRGRGRDRDRDNGYDNRSNNGGYSSGRPNESMMHWSGNVDDQLEIRIQGGRVSYRTLSGAQPTSMRVSNGFMNVPRNDASIAVVQNQGRGTVRVVEQPTSRNGFATVILVRDPQGGYGFYDFDLMWQ